MTITRIAGAICLPGGVMLAPPDVVLEETFSAPWERDFHHHLHRAADETYTLKQDAADPVFLPGPHLCLDYQHYQHYGHFIVDVLSRAWAYDFLTAYLNVADLKVLVCNAPAPFASELLDLFGIPDDRFVRLDRPMTVEELFVPTKSFQIQEYTSHAASATWRRIGNAERGEGGPKQVYVSRSRIGSRRMVNEPEVEALMRSKGFTVVHPQELSIRQQVGLFAGAELIVGASGSNMFNLGFQRRLRAALILASPTLVHHTDVFMNVGHKCELAYFIGDRAADAPGFNPADVHAPWRIDMDAFSACFESWLRTRPGR